MEQTPAMVQHSIPLGFRHLSFLPPSPLTFLPSCLQQHELGHFLEGPTKWVSLYLPFQLFFFSNFLDRYSAHSMEIFKLFMLPLSR